ncbi:hypothetical protein CTAYLR_003151 [Chrysophaeum taylorii]|uniref:TRUD domain-containing protein n=1 Tax=Chrysophaeum taylorii TaxID=2483200 RepID=A0AAD7UQQ6_9STRA|nr:hypothetical protein CTAYLR_003151 [Chrysophaeum taylorii]
MDELPRWGQTKKILKSARLKKSPGDFIVDEISEEGGRASEEATEVAGNLCVLRKEDVEGLGAERVIKRALQTTVSTAGIKDKRAITYQFVSLGRTLAARRTWRGLALTPVGSRDRALETGQLSGNAFRVTLREVVGEIEMPSELEFPNYFGPQRVGSWRHGRAMLRRDYAELMLLVAPELETMAPKKVARKMRKTNLALSAVREYGRTGDAKSAIAAVPHRAKALWIHAYQSYLFNVGVAAVLRPGAEQHCLGLVGSQVPPEEDAVRAAMAADGITQQDFPRWCRGSPRRPVVATATNIQARRVKDDLRLSFELPPGSFATSFLREICDDLSY